jgi:hypothetical protein
MLKVIITATCILFASPVSAAVQFQTTFQFEGGFRVFGHPPVPQNNGFDYYFTPVQLDTHVLGHGVTVTNLSVSVFGENNGDTVNWDLEVFIGPTPFGLPEGQFENTLVDPVSGYDRIAPTQLSLSVGSRADPQSYSFSVEHDFTTADVSVFP